MNTRENFDQPSSLASLIDHTLLKPEATERDIIELCAQAREFSFATVCVNPCWVRLAAQKLISSPVKVCTVIGFPLGASETQAKIFEAELAISSGATELDMVQNVGFLRSGLEDHVRREIEQLAQFAHSRKAILKVILETSLLDEQQKRTACRLASEANADFVKTSTGFSTGGAAVGDVTLMRQTVGKRMGVKASGGIRTLAGLKDMVRAGANRIGTSSGVQILDELNAQLNPEKPRSDAIVSGAGTNY